MYMSPSPLCVLLTLCCDDVHSDGGEGKVLLGRGLGHDWRALHQLTCSSILLFPCPYCPFFTIMF